MSNVRSHPTQNEVKLSRRKFIVSKTDAKGKILYANEYFSEVCGYKVSELVGSPHNIIRHPDMPKAVFSLLWQHIQNGKNVSAVVKNLTKNGDYYWVVTDFEIRRNSVTDEISQYVAFRHPVSKKVVKKIEPLYAKMLEIEKEDGMTASIDYLNSVLEEKQMDYNQYIEKLAKPGGVAGKLFKKLKDFFDEA
jgi:PAS domain S-box-containing protein